MTAPNYDHKTDMFLTHTGFFPYLSDWRTSGLTDLDLHFEVANILPDKSIQLHVLPMCLGLSETFKNVSPRPQGTHPQVIAKYLQQ